MFKNLKLSYKITVGFSLLILIAVALGGLAVYKMGEVRDESEKLSEQYVPESVLAGQLNCRAGDAMYEMRGYSYTGGESYLKATR
ncbi:MAG: chemotaxis protein, partial [Phycisphaerae bacterium]